MSDITLPELKPQQPHATPDGSAIASLILGILGITVLPFIGGILAVILGRVSMGEARKRSERGSAVATAESFSDGSAWRSPSFSSPRGFSSGIL